MYIIRPAKYEDLDELVELAQIMAPGITTFPPDNEVIKHKVHQSISAFSDTHQSSEPGSFLLVLEDTLNNRVVGTAGVYSQIGHSQPFYSFKLVSQTQLSEQAQLKCTSTTLHLTNAFQGGTEVGTLLLHPDYNGKGLGKFLSKSRYMLIRAFEDLFNEPAFAELRGWTDESGRSPFWEALGRHFFDQMDFDKADLLSATTNNQFIADMMPRYPIYLDILPDDAKAVIGKANPKGEGALQMLFKEGFRDEGYIDIFDAGATVVARFEDIHTFKNAKKLTLVMSDEIPNEEKLCFLATTEITNFRMINLTQYIVDGDNLIINKSATTQGFEEGQEVLFYPC